MDVRIKMSDTGSIQFSGVVYSGLSFTANDARPIIDIILKIFQDYMDQFKGLDVDYSTLSKKEKKKLDKDRDRNVPNYVITILPEYEMTMRHINDHLSHATKRFGRKMDIDQTANIMRVVDWFKCIPVGTKVPIQVTDIYYYFNRLKHAIVLDTIVLTQRKYIIIDYSGYSEKFPRQKIKDDIYDERRRVAAGFQCYHLPERITISGTPFIK